MAVTTYNTSLPVPERYQNGKVQISLVWNSRNEHSENHEKLNALCNFLWRNGGARSSNHLIHSIWANFQTSNSNVCEWDTCSILICFNFRLSVFY
ncbi:hypothetical protein BHE74_00053262 [Ensete ventricosum]|nr:hypothetical protein GW17_00053661 [Ensete ventricosum]RWW41264.1 hypothetical protein BHE74_00053262 [Ensete ventricosum]RZS19443.1 hypothetical protein BHM03_00051838 [Ensete ventricosum]